MSWEEPTRERRRRERARQDFRPTPAIERMAAQHEADPADFLRVYGGRGLIIIGTYASTKRAAGIDDDREPA